MANDFIIDFETLGKEDKAVLLSVGVMCVPNLDKNWFINELTPYTIHIKINREEQIRKGRTLDKETISWWEEQGDEAREILSNDNLKSSEYTYKCIKKFMKEGGFEPKSSKIWSRGMIDQRWWQSFCKTFDFEDFLPFWCWRDTRTLLETLSGSPTAFLNNEPSLIKHNAAHDCILDFIRIQLAIKGEDQVPF